MISIKSKPEAFNYTLSLPRLSYMSTQASTLVTLYRGAEKILEETYNPFDFKTAIELDFDTLIDGLQHIELPTTEDITVHNQGAASYKITIVDSDMTVPINFVAIKGFYYLQPLDLDLFFKTTWLNVHSDVRLVKSFQPVYLTAFAQQKINIKIKVIMEDKTTQVLPFGVMEYGKIQTVDVSPYLIQQLLTNKIVEYSVYGTDDNNKEIISNIRHLIQPNDIYRDDYFVFQNRLGGWESITLGGQKTNSHKNVSSLALMDKKNVRYADDKTRTVKKNTGYITGFDQKVLLIEMIYSNQCYHILDGAPRLINFKEPTVELTEGTLNETDLEFTYSDPAMANPRLERQPNYLTI